MKQRCDGTKVPLRPGMEAARHSHPNSSRGTLTTGNTRPGLTSRRVDWLSIKRTRLNDVPLAAQHHAFMRRDTRPNQPRSDLHSDCLIGKPNDGNDVPKKGPEQRDMPKRGA